MEATDPLDAATTRLMSALALHEDFRDTVRDALQDAYDAGAASVTIHTNQSGSER